MPHNAPAQQHHKWHAPFPQADTEPSAALRYDSAHEVQVNHLRHGFGPDPAYSVLVAAEAVEHARRPSFLHSH